MLFVGLRGVVVFAFICFFFYDVSLVYLFCVVCDVFFNVLLLRVSVCCVFVSFVNVLLLLCCCVFVFCLSRWSCFILFVKVCVVVAFAFICF